MSEALKIVNVDGKKHLLINGKTLLSKTQVTQQIAALKERANKQLPAVRSGLNAKALLEQAQANIDRQIEKSNELKSELESLLKELD